MEPYNTAFFSTVRVRLHPYSAPLPARLLSVFVKIQRYTQRKGGKQDAGGNVEEG